MPVARSDASVFHAIADPTRRAALEVLAEREMPAMEVLARVRAALRGKRGRGKVTQSGFSQHLAVLRRAGLVEERRAGRRRIYRVRPGPLREVVDWMDLFDKFWTDRLEGLGRYLEKTREKQ